MHSKEQIYAKESFNNLTAQTKHSSFISSIFYLSNSLFELTRQSLTEFNRGGFFTFTVRVTTNQLWNTHYSDYQTYLYNRITELKQEGLGYRKIAKLLNAEGVRTARNKEFLPASIHSILKKKKLRETRISKEFNKEVSALELQYIDL